MMLEIARFWAAIAHFNQERERFEIDGVMAGRVSREVPGRR